VCSELSASSMYPLDPRRTKLLGALTSDEWRRVDDIADVCESSSVWCRGELAKLIKLGEVEMREFPCDASNFTVRKYRGIPTGRLQHLFSSPPVNPRLLADCWGGYTYHKE
jgi:hypothetical protein